MHITIRVLLLLVAIFCIKIGIAQELYVFTEPASNIPAHSISAKVGYRSPDSKFNNYYKQRITPELMLGLSKNCMVHISSSFSDFFSSQLGWESIKGYAKWRFFSRDEVHQHFRMAAFVEASYTRNPFLYDELTLDGDNNGVQGGIVATQLLHKLALSASGSVIKIFAERNEHVHGEGHSLEAFNYNFSAGYLLYPRAYTGYNQTNINIYTEFLGMKGINGKDYMLDIAPALQFIFNSTTKLNLGARFQLAGNMIRVGERNYYIGIERIFLDVLKKRKK
jgi:hypothetical protein